MWANIRDISLIVVSVNRCFLTFIVVTVWEHSLKPFCSLLDSLIINRFHLIILLDFAIILAYLMNIIQHQELLQMPLRVLWKNQKWRSITKKEKLFCYFQICFSSENRSMLWMQTGIHMTVWSSCVHPKRCTTFLSKWLCCESWLFFPFFLYV